MYDELKSDRSALPLLMADHLRTHPETVVFLFGSGMVIPNVPGVHAVVDMARRWTQRDQTARVDDTLELPPSSSRRIGPEDYDRTMDRILRRFLADGQRAFVQRLALEAFQRGDAAGLRRQLDERPHEPLTREQFRRLVDDNEAWQLPAGVTAFAKIFASHPALPKIIFTTNFDPLLTVALNREGLSARPVTATTDTHLQADRTINDAVVVVHLHGDCYAEPTLHTREELGAQRPNTQRLLADRLRGKNLLVVGYSGWDDIVRTTLELTLDPSGGLSVMWAVHEPDDAALRAAHPHLSSFLKVHHPQTIGYMGIDRDALFAEVLRLAIYADRESQPPFVQVAETLRDEFGFGIDLTRTSPQVLFWPHRLRKPHLIHGVHALAAAAVAKTNVAVELHLDDLGLDAPLAEDLASEFVGAIGAWFKSVGVVPPVVTRLSQRINLADPESRASLWGLAEELNKQPITGAEVLGAWKLLDPSILDAGPLVATQHLAQALRKPLQGHLVSSLYTFLALQRVLQQFDGDARAIVTLGGADERPMWDLWHHIGPRVGHIFVPRLDWRSESDLWGIRPLQRGSEYGSRDLAAFLVAAASEEGAESLIDWIWTCAVRLRNWVAEDETDVGIEVGEQTIRSSDEAFKLLTLQPTHASGIADAVGRWFYAGPRQMYPQA